MPVQKKFLIFKMALVLTSEEGNRNVTVSSEWLTDGNRCCLSSAYEVLSQSWGRRWEQCFQPGMYTVRVQSAACVANYRSAVQGEVVWVGAVGGRPTPVGPCGQLASDTARTEAELTVVIIHSVFVFSREVAVAIGSRWPKSRGHAEPCSHNMAWL